MKDFKEKVIFIVGATGGIGSEIVNGLSGSGARLILFSRNSEKLQNLKKNLDNEVIAFEGDATKSRELEAAVAEAIDKFGKIDVLIHAVGSIVLKSIQNLTEENFRDTLELNLISPFLAIKSVIPVMVKQKSGSIVVISSVAGSKGLMNHEAISAAKGGLEGLVRSTAITYAKRGIRVNGVALGLVDTPLAEFLTKNELSLKASVSLHPMNRIGKPNDVSGAILYLASDQSQWTTGTIIPVDGGMAAN